MTEDTNFLDTQQAARYRVSGDGPVFHRFGNRIRYRRAALDAWADARERVSTADDGGRTHRNSRRRRPRRCPRRYWCGSGTSPAGIPTATPWLVATRACPAHFGSTGTFSASEPAPPVGTTS